jgi:tryptophan halogenase
MSKKIVIVGSGTAGCVSAIMLKSFFKDYEVTVVSSSTIGIVGVGEGTTEHWRDFQSMCGIDAEELICQTDATHKYGILFENWTTHTPNYYHSVAGPPFIKDSFYVSYSYALANKRLLTQAYSWVGMHENKILNDKDMHKNTNQYHFDTFKLNKYLMSILFKKEINHIDDEVGSVDIDTESGFIKSITLEKTKQIIEADFFIDASGFKRVLMGNLDKQNFISYKKYLPCDSAIAFPSESDPSGQIRPYTRARALKNGWMWEIPTQSRRGNGYVFDSNYCTQDEAVKEASEIHGFEVVPARTFKFDSGYYKNPWVKNCLAVGLSSGFVEPLEATSISTSIQQIRMLVPFLPTFKFGNNLSITSYNKSFDDFMENLLLMISLHYVSDREDTPMWKAQRKAEKPELLQFLLDLWKEKTPDRNDIPYSKNHLFQIEHIWHVAQGQGVIDPMLAIIQLNDHNSWEKMKSEMINHKRRYLGAETIDHAEALRNLRKKYGI